MMKRFVLVCAMVAVAGMPLCARANILIDDFQAPEFSREMAFSGEVYSRPTDSGLNVIGGSRSITYTQLQSSGGGDSVNINDGAGYLTSNNGPGGSAYFEFFYDALGQGLHADLSGQNHIAVDWKPDHLGNLKTNFMSFTLTDALDNAYESRIDWASYWYNAGNSPLTTLFLLDDFASHGVDLSDIKSIRFKYESDDANDVIIDKFSTVVPEPATMALLGAGLAGLFLRRKKALY